MGLLESGRGSGGLKVGKVSVGNGKFSFEVLPCLVGGSGAAPFVACFVELLCAKHDQICIVDNLTG